MSIESTPRPSEQTRRGERSAFRPIGRRGTVEKVIARLAEPLRFGTLKVGDLIPSERALAEQLEVSRSTVRKALAELVGADVLEPVQGAGSDRGLRVRSNVFPPGLLGESLEALSIAEIASVLEARRLLEPRVAQLAALVATPEDFERLEDMIATQRRAVDDPFRLRRLDAQFHLMIAEATHNRTVMLMMHALYERLELTRHPTIQPDEGAHTLDVHERTLSALMSRDPETVETMMDEHLSVMEDAWERETGRSFKRTVPEFLARSRDRR